MAKRSNKSGSRNPSLPDPTGQPARRRDGRPAAISTGADRPVASRRRPEEVRGGARGCSTGAHPPEPLTQAPNPLRRKLAARKGSEGGGRGNANANQNQKPAAPMTSSGPVAGKRNHRQSCAASDGGDFRSPKAQRETAHGMDIAGHRKKHVKASKPGHKGGRAAEQTAHWDLATMPRETSLNVPTMKRAEFTPYPSLELARFRKSKKLRKLLVQLCRGKQVAVPLLCFERWLSRCRLHELKQSASDSDPDPLLPSTGWIDPGLIKDLTRAKMSEPDAREAAETLVKASCTAVKALQDLRNGLESGVEKPTDAITVKPSGPISKVQLGDNKPYMTINNQHLGKLRQLFRRHSSGGQGDNQPSFDAHLWCLLARYESLSGHGYQAALSEHAFGTLRDCMGVQLECFASPLNCYFGRFCSAFPDCDGMFGSIGSFFDFCPSGGSYEANPPFVPEMMSAMIEHMEALLHRAADALSFTIVIPAWKSVRAWKQLQRSRFLQAIWIVEAKSHVFCDGAQHQQAHRYRPSSYDTAIAFLQNAAGHSAWPPGDEVKVQLIQAMGEGQGLKPMSIADYEKRHSRRGKAVVIESQQ